MKKIKPFIVLHIILLIFSTGGIFSKLASGQTFLSLNFCLLYGAMIFILGIYALLWQQILKYIPLTTAYVNKAVTIIWSTLWGTLLFHETITVQNVIGAIIVLAGVIIMVTGEDKKHE